MLGGDDGLDPVSRPSEPGASHTEVQAGVRAEVQAAHDELAEVQAAVRAAKAEYVRLVLDMGSALAATAHPAGGT